MGGLKQYFHRLFRELLENDRDNTYVFFYFEHNIDELNGLGTAKWKEKAIMLKDQSEVDNHLNEIDVYFCPFGALWPRPIAKPSVVTLVDIQEKFFPQFFTKEDHWNREYHFKPSTKAADHVITISNFSKSSIMRFHGISGKKVHVSYLSADEIFYTADEGCKLALSLPDRYIFYPANRWLHKNHDNLLRAMAILKRKGMAVDCVFTGFDVPNGYPLQAKIEDYGLKDHVWVLKYVSNEELGQIYKKAAMLCFPSLFEGFGMPLVEAMASGCPVACSNTTSLPEVVGDAALLFDPKDPDQIADCIFSILTDETVSGRLRAKGHRQAKLFSAEKTAAVHKEVFNLAAKTYRKRRYLYYKHLYEPIITRKMKLKRDF